MRILLITLSVCFAYAAAKNVKRTTGVEFSRFEFYSDEKEFLCLDGSKTIPSDQINDDFCDCPDGSDEPGTSACSNGIFYCANLGHAPNYIPTSRVNDGICDCCDGSDEYETGVCSNICHELGKSAREEKERKAKIARKGYQIRKEKSLAAHELKKQKEESIIPLKAEKDVLEAQKQNLESKKKEVEDKEKVLVDAHRDKWLADKLEKKKVKAAVLFKEIDIDGDEKISIPELQVLGYLDSNFDGQVSEDEAKHHTSQSDSIDFDTFTSNVYESLKSAKRQYDGDKRDREQDDLVADEDKVEDLNNDEEENDPDDAMPPHDDETKQAIDDADAARRDLSDLEVKISTIDSQIKEAEMFLNHDYGADLAWVSLKGQCFELNDMQYIYKVCPFDRTVQKDKNGHGETNLGYWKDWSGKVPRKYNAQKYEDGVQCWNGPKRSTEVFIECGETNELYEASEPAKCEYQFKFRTPMACNDPDKEEPIHTEL